ncbi:elongation factor 1-beta [Candidatus Woesearchaeota archaeon]|nr:elongation factor 1-beta [Candidatus Woesearchaeota archaeon]
MAQVVVTLKIMPDGPESDLSPIQDKAKEEIRKFAGKAEIKVEIEPIAFGLKALKIFFTMDESKGSTDELEDKIREIPEVSSVEAVDVRRAVG